MGSLIDATTRAAPEEVFRLKSVEIEVSTAEQLAKARAKAPDVKAHAGLKVVWEPLSYRKQIDGQPVVEEVDHIRITLGDGLSRLDGTDELTAIQRVEQGGLHAVPSNVRINLPRNITKADPTKQERPYSRFMVACVKANLRIDVDEDGSVTGKPGQVFSPDIGKIYKCTSGYEDFPQWDGVQRKWDWNTTSTKFMRLPVAMLTDYVQPDDIPTRSYETSTSSDTAPVSAINAAPTDNITALEEAVDVLKIRGQQATVVNSAAIDLCLANVADATVLASREVLDAAGSGSFVAYLAGKGVISIDTDGVIR